MTADRREATLAAPKMRRALTSLGLVLFGWVTVSLLSACEETKAALFDNEKLPTATSPADLQSMSLSDTTLPADGQSTATVTANSSHVPAAIPQVFLATDAGVFVATNANTATVPFDATGAAEALLRAPRDPGQSVVRAITGSSALATTITFTRAYPDSVLVDLPQFVIDTGASIAVGAWLRRAIGQVSPGTQVSFTATGGGHAVGSFGVPTVSDTAGHVTVLYSAHDSSGYTGPVTIQATVATSDSTAVAGQAELTIFATPKTP